MKRSPLAPSLLLIAAGCTTPPATAPSPIAWRPWSAEAFAAARAERRLVLLDLGAQWCHWCHVMARVTWQDANVRDVLARSFVAIEADADRRLDLAARYQDYGWPALVVFDAEGRELWKHRGFVPPERMAAVLARLAADPVPLAADAAPTGVSATTSGLAPVVEAALRARLEALHDDEHGGFGFVHKYLDGPGAEWLLLHARGGDATATRRLLRLLDAERALHDPVWGGAYQYSHGGVWTNPHFEKVMSRQLADLRAYSLAFGAFGRDAHLVAARNVARFLLTMLRAPEGAFFASQDADVVPGEHSADYFAADDAARRASGLPRIERSLWSRENGQAIQGLCALLAVDPGPDLRAAVLAAAEWIVAHRRLPDGLFAHGDDDRGGPFLADSLEMATAAAALHEVFGDERWLELAAGTVHAIGGQFVAAGGGYASARGDGLLAPVVDRTENVQLARLAHRLALTNGDAALRAIADRAFAWVAAETIALQPGLPADLLLAAHERAHEPVHVVVVGDAADPARRELVAAALRHAPPFRRVERVRPGAAAGDGTIYPFPGHAVAYVCRDGACSAPIADATTLAAKLSPSATRPDMSGRP